MWICCQLGAREHYSVPLALRRKGKLGGLITDFWAGHTRLFAGWSARASERTHPELSAEEVVSFPLSLIRFEAGAGIRRLRGWDRIIRRNEWFQHEALKALRTIGAAGEQRVLFSYSYAARRLFEYAKSRGWSTVLGQIDPGPPEERIVQELHHKYSSGKVGISAPRRYWESWRAECDLADRIVVNSEWSRRALLEEGVSEQKLDIIPLAFDPPENAKRFRRSYPTKFTSSRPLRALFLGQINLRKGVPLIFKAVPALSSRPVEFHFVGSLQMDIPAELARSQQVYWHGPVSRRQTEQHYRDADLFLFPTFSDGFGLTQLEASAWSLPVIASEFCGDVVEDGENGRILRPLTSEMLVSVLLEFLKEPGKLAALAKPWDAGDRFSLEALACNLLRATLPGRNTACLKA